jgi:hypothetical protein
MLIIETFVSSMGRCSVGLFSSCRRNSCVLLGAKLFCEIYISNSCIVLIYVLKFVHFNLLKPTAYVMHQLVLTFNNCTLCPHCIYVFCIYLITNSDLCHLQHKLIGFVTEMKSVYSAVRTGSLNKAVRASSLKG